MHVPHIQPSTGSQCSLQWSLSCIAMLAMPFFGQNNFFLQIPCSPSSLPFPTFLWHKHLNYSFNKHRYYQKPLITSASIIVLLVYSASNQWACLYSLSLSLDPKGTDLSEFVISVSHLRLAPNRPNLNQFQKIKKLKFWQQTHKSLVRYN